MHNVELGALTVAVLFALMIIGIAWKPVLALGITGFLLIIGGVFAMSSVGPSVGVSTVIGGIVLIALGRMVEIAQNAVAELRGLRRDLRETRLARKPDTAT